MSKRKPKGVIEAGIGERLAASLKLRATSIRQFCRVMRQQGTAGSSYPAIHRYLKDRAVPSVEFLSAAANLLDVRLAWLIEGENGGPMTTDLVKREIQGQLSGVARSLQRGMLLYTRALDRWDTDDGDSEAKRRRKMAIMRFMPRLEDARIAVERMAADQVKTPGLVDGRNKSLLAKMAIRYLIRAEQTFVTDDFKHRQVLTPCQMSHSQYVAWSDAVLATLAMCLPEDFEYEPEQASPKPKARAK